jgi:hypothetical protein
LDDDSPFGYVARARNNLVFALEVAAASSSVPDDDALPRPPRDLRGNSLLDGHSCFGEDRGQWQGDTVIEQHAHGRQTMVAQLRGAGVRHAHSARMAPTHDR